MDTLTKEVLNKDEDLKKIHNKIHKIEDWDLLHKNPMVTICMATYNHENYIREALDGVLMQKTGFEYEIIIKEDKSTDKTREIVEDYQKKHPDKIRLWLCKENLYSQKLKPQLDAFARGKYIARCEGDDYWIDPLKLQKQVVFLEENQDYNVCVGRYKFYYQNSGTFKKNRDFASLNKVLTLKDYLAYKFSHTATFLYRKNFEKLPDWMKKVYAGDQSIIIVVARDKKIKYFKDFFSVYRVHNTSVSSQFAKKDPKIAYDNGEKYLTVIDNYTNHQYAKIIYRRRKLNTLYFKMESSKSKIEVFFYKSYMFLYRWYVVKTT